MKREELNTPKMLRRVRLDLNTPAELAIFKAMQEVEKAGADVRLTEATMLLAKAKDCVADFIDGVEHPLPPAEGADSSKGDFDDVLKKERKCVCGAELKHRGGISFWCDNPHCKTAYVFDADGHISEYGTVEQKGTPRQTVGGAGHHFASKEIEQPTAEGEIPPDPTAEAGCGIYYPTGRKPTAEGAGKPYMCPVCCGNGLVPNGFYNTVSGLGSTTSITPETCRSCNGTGVVFAALYAQQIADKMVGERLRKELMTYDKFLSNTYWGISHITKREEAVNEYLKSREK
jgi:hypothetical protein